MIGEIRSCPQVPVNSKTDLLLASAEPIPGTGETSAMIYLRRDHTVEQVKSMGRRNSMDKFLWPDCNPHSPSPIPHTAWGGNVEELGVKLSLERRRYRGKVVFSFVFISPYPILLLTDNKGN